MAMTIIRNWLKVIYTMYSIMLLTKLNMYVCLTFVVHKLHTVAILARSSRDISQTVHIDCHSFLSRVRISVRSSYDNQLKLVICVCYQSLSRPHNWGVVSV